MYGCSTDYSWNVSASGRPAFRRMDSAESCLLDLAGHCEPVSLLCCLSRKPIIVGAMQGFALIGMGAASAFQGLQAYVIDSFPRYSASGEYLEFDVDQELVVLTGPLTALAAVSCFRSLAGFGFPLFAPYMYKSLGYGKGDTILAAFCLGVGSPAYVLFFFSLQRNCDMSDSHRSHVPSLLG